MSQQVRATTHDVTLVADFDRLTPTITGSMLQQVRTHSMLGHSTRMSQSGTIYYMELMYQDTSWMVNRSFAEFQALDESLVTYIA